MPRQVGFYAGLNLIAWFLIFCFVRETKQLTLEELDRESQDLRLATIYSADSCPHRGFLRPDQEVHLARVDGVATLFHEAVHSPAQDCQAASNHRKGGEGGQGLNWGLSEMKVEEKRTVVLGEWRLAWSLSRGRGRELNS